MLRLEGKIDGDKHIKTFIMKNLHSYISVLALILAILFSGCKTQDTSSFPNTISLKGKLLSIGDKIGQVHSLEAVDDYLIFTDYQEESQYTILKPDLSYCFYFGRKGQGPREMPQSSGVKMIRNGHLILSDGYRLYRHSLDSLYHSIDHPIPSPKSDKIDTHVWVSDLTDSLFIATGTFPNGKRFKIFDNKGTPLAYIGDYPLDEKIDLPFYVIGSAYVSMMTSHPTSNRFAVGTNYGGMLDVMEWNASDYTLNRIGGVCEFKPQVSSKSYQGTPNFVPNEKTRWGYLNMDSDANYIYALYSGRFQIKGTRYWWGNTIHVFDWNGTPVCQIKLDKDVRDIAVMKNKLYALYEDADIGYEIMEYVLPDNWTKK